MRCGARRGATAGSSRRARASARTSTPTSTTTRSCSRRCSSSCRRGFAPRTTRGRARSPTCCSTSSRTPGDGGFFFTSHDHERLFHRTKPGHDNATPSGNGVAAAALIALGHLCAEPRYVEAAERALRLFAPALAHSPGGYASLLAALEEARVPPTTVLLAGDPRRLHGVAARARATTAARRCASSTSPASRSPPELAKGPAPAGGRRRVGLPRHAVPAADGRPGRDRARDRAI